MNQDGKIIILIHGLWMTPTSLDLFKGFFERRGYRVIAPAWPGLTGDAAAMRSDPSKLAGLGVLEIADHYDSIVREFSQPPILMGHSFGGLIVQMLLDRGLGSAGVALDAVVPKGIWTLPMSAIRAARPVLLNPLNYGRTVMLTFAQFQYAFANTMTESEARAAYEREVIPGPGRPVFQAAFANLTPRSAVTVNHLNYKRSPSLLISAAYDNLVPAALNEANFQKYTHSTATTDYAVFADRSHLLIAQPGWEEVAEYAISWVERKAGISPRLIEPEKKTPGMPARIYPSVAARSVIHLPYEARQ